MNKITSIYMLIRLTIIGSSIALMVPGTWGNSITVVELAQLPSGLAAWQSGSLGIYRVCGPVSKWLYSFGPYIAGIRVTYPPSFDTDLRLRHEWDLGRRFQIQHQQTCQAIYRWSRLLPILVTILGGCLVCEWSTRLFGAWPGIVSLCVWCWMEPVLAHGMLVTSDMASAVLTLLAARTFRSFLIRPSIWTMLASGAALGLAQATKYTMLVLVPCWTGILIYRSIQLRNSQVTSRSETGISIQSIVDKPFPSTARFFALGVGIAIISLLILNLCYEFNGIGFPLSEWTSGHSSLSRDVQRMANSSATAWLLYIPLPIPIEYLHGLDVQLADTERLQSGYLLGHTRPGGWWYWYALAALLKIPLPALMLGLMAIARLPVTIRRVDDLLWSGLCLIVPAVEIFLIISVTTGTGSNAAFRDLLPSLALISVWVGSVCNDISRKITYLLLFWSFVCAVSAMPDHLGWENELGWIAERWTGKPPLIGDSLDWGQDLLRLGVWIEEHAGRGNTAVCVYNLGIGEPFGLRYPTARSSLKGAEYLAVSENILYGSQNYISISINGEQSSLTAEQCEVLRNIPSFQRVGRTIRIYRLKELPKKNFPD